MEENPKGEDEGEFEFAESDGSGNGEDIATRTPFIRGNPMDDFGGRPGAEGLRRHDAATNPAGDRPERSHHGEEKEEIHPVGAGDDVELKHDLRRSFAEDLDESVESGARFAVLRGDETPAQLHPPRLEQQSDGVTVEHGCHQKTPHHRTVNLATGQHDSVTT